ncbi:MAG: Dyp-type peroxidase [Nannocystaceae bacterium]
MSCQPGILEPVPAAARYLRLQRRPDVDPRPALRSLAGASIGGDVFGLGPTLVRELDGAIPGLRELPALAGPGVAAPATPAALWCWLRGDDRGALLHRGRALAERLAAGFYVEDVVDGFRYDRGLDLTGYEDGTENPEGARAVEAAIAAGLGPGLDGSSFVAVQRWRHELDRFAALPGEAQDHVFGRRRADNEELDDAPPSAHVKRTAQESFTPEAFVVRRSMPWADDRGEGLIFVAFGRTLDPFEALLRRMLGLEDGITDALFRFTRPVTGGAFWCPPCVDGRLDLSALGL